jgi:hypothetical protein
MFAPQHSTLVRFHCAVREDNLLLRHDTTRVTNNACGKTTTCTAHIHNPSGCSAKGTHSQSALKELTHRVHFNICITQGVCLSPDCLLFSRHNWSSLTNGTAMPSTALSLVNKPLYIWKTNEQRCYLTSILVLPSAKANFHLLINNTGLQMIYRFKRCLQYACQELWKEGGSVFREQNHPWLICRQNNTVDILKYRPFYST